MFQWGFGFKVEGFGILEGLLGFRVEGSLGSDLRSPARGCHLVPLPSPEGVCDVGHRRKKIKEDLKS